MNDRSSLPSELTSALGSENTDFIVKAAKVHPKNKSIKGLIFSAAWIGFTSIFAAVFIGPVLLGREVSFELNGVPTTASPDNLEPLLFPGAMIALFGAIGLAILVGSIVMLTKRGGWFVGTPDRLISFRKGTLRSIDWQQFSGDITVTGNDQKGDVLLGMRTGVKVNDKNRTDSYIPEKIYLVGIEDAQEIGRLCRERIEEHDES